MPSTNTPRFIVRGSHKRFEVNTVIYAVHYVKPDGKMYELADDAYLGINRAWDKKLPGYIKSLPTYPG